MIDATSCTCGSLGYGRLQNRLPKGQSGEHLHNVQRACGLLSGSIFETGIFDIGNLSEVPG
jgi:hypothetical protein